MTPTERQAADDYFAQARSWSNEATDSLRRSRQIAWVVAITAAVIAMLEAIAILTMLPLKSIVPYTLLVDRQTGHVQALDPLDVTRLAPDRALTQSFLVQYVLAREGFNRTTVQQDYRKVMLWSADEARRSYGAMMPATNTDSPLVRVPRGITLDPRIRSVSSVGERRALVRFETVQVDNLGGVRAAQPWVAIVDYRFSTAPMSAEDRFVNPLGFQVIRYQRSPEALPVETVPATIGPPLASSSPMPAPTGVMPQPQFAAPSTKAVAP